MTPTHKTALESLDDKWRNGIEAAIGVANDRQTIIENLVTLCERMIGERETALTVEPIEGLVQFAQLKDGQTAVFHHSFPPHIWDGEKMVRLEAYAAMMKE